MDTNAFNRAYLPLLTEHKRLVELEIETMESYITEENFDEFFTDYMTLQSRLSEAHREIARVGRELGLRKKQIRELINS